MEQHAHLAGAEIEKRRRIAWHATFDTRLAAAGRAARADSRAAFTDAQRETVAAMELVMVAGAARDVAIAGQQRIVE